VSQQLVVLWPACVVHAAGCRDIGRDVKTRFDCESIEPVSGISKWDVAAYIWEDQISDTTEPGCPDYDETVDEFVGYTEWKPCVTLPWNEV
jgi:hypothetical protein